VTGDDYNGLLKLYDQQKANFPKFNIGLLSEPSWESVIALRTAIKLLQGENVPKRQIIEPQAKKSHAKAQRRKLEVRIQTSLVVYPKSSEG
jgi:hypothetical protein